VNCLDLAVGGSSFGAR